MSRLITDIKYGLKEIFRDKMNLFWIFIFPTVLLLLFGNLLGGQSQTLTLYYQDDDGSQMSDAFVQALNSTGALELKDGSGMDLEQMLKDGKISAYLEIPGGFGQSVTAARTDNSSGAGLSIHYDKSKSTSLAVVSVVQQVANNFNIKMSNSRDVITVNSQDTATSGMNYFDFLLPGILAITVMCAAQMSVGTITRLRSSGVFRKLSTTPISTKEWLAARIITWTILMVLSVAVAMFVAWLAFGIHPNINLITLLLIVVGTALFAGLGLLISNFVRNEESAMNATGVITFPLMFVSGTFVPVESMPWFLQYLAKISPLTYLSNGLRSSMITGNYGDGLTNLAIVAGLGVLLFGFGTVLFNWKED